MKSLVASQPSQLTIPGPRPVLGGYGNLLQIMNDPVKVMGELFRKYGSVANLAQGTRVRLFSSYPTVEGVVFVRGAELLRQISTNHETYHRYHLVGGLSPGKDTTLRKRPLNYFGAGLFDMNEGEHRRARRLMMPAFHRKRVDTYRDGMVELTEKMIGSWKFGEQRNVHYEMTQLTMQIVTGMLFGIDPYIAGARLGHTIEDSLKLGFHPLTFLLPYDFPGSVYGRLLDLVQVVEDEMRRIIYEKRLSSEDGNDVLSMLMAARDEEDGSRISDDDLIAHAELLFIAGHETSSNALAWTLLILSQHPDILADVVDELDSVLKGDPPTLEQLQKLPLLERVIKESMRLCPPVVWNSRVAVQEDMLGDHRILPSTEILMSIYWTHHDPETYPQPERFDPSRWEHNDYGIFEYVPFSGGPRMCIGATFAMMEIRLVLAMLLQRFRFEIPRGTTVNRLVSATMILKPGLPMILHPQDRQFHRGVGGVRGQVREMVELPT
jgi:cytochrome P450